MAANQPPVVNNNTFRILWTEEQCLYLINQRLARNNEFWSLESYHRREFWLSVANKINECFGTRFSYRQVDRKWNNLLQDHLDQIAFRLGGREGHNSRSGRIYYDLFEEESWMEPVPLDVQIRSVYEIARGRRRNRDQRRR